MSRCYCLKSENFINLDAVLETAQKMINKGLTVKLDVFEPSEGEGGCFYIEGKASRGVQVFHENDNIVVKINILCNHADYIMAKIILDILGNALGKEIIDEEDTVILADDYFTDEKIQELREGDAETFLAALKAIVKNSMQIFGVVRKVYFGKNITQELIKYEKDSKALVKAFDSIIHHVQYELPDYNMPGAALIHPKDSENEKDFKKIRMMFEGTPYILQDYDFLTISADEKSEEIIFIDNDDLSEIAPKLFKEDSEFEFADDFTIVFPKLEGGDWKKFVELARTKHHKEMLATKPVTKTENLTPDHDPETAKEEDEISNQCHGTHWDCILENKEKEFHNLLAASIREGTLYGQTECDYTLRENLHGKVVVIEFDEGDSDSDIVIRDIIAEGKDGKNELVSGYPVVRGGVHIPLKIEEIKEWENGLEAWITGELVDGSLITFFDADYAINKDKYVIGKPLDFIIGALAYYAEEFEFKGFSFEGQEAIDFKAKTGEKPEFDEEGNVKPVQLSTKKLCAFFQLNRAPDDAEFITTVEDIKTVKALGKSFRKFNTIYRRDEGTEDEIPTYVLKTNDNNSLDKAAQIQGVLWLTGYLAK